LQLIKEILNTVPEGAVNSVIVGLNWTAVSVEVNGKRLCGLSSTIKSPHTHGNEYDVPDAGSLTTCSARELASLCASDKPALASVGTAALNALLQHQDIPHVEKNAEELIAEHGKDQHVVIVGHFPFTERIRLIASHLDVLENSPKIGDLHASRAPEVIPNARVVAITGMSFVNKTLDDLLALCSPGATVIMLGASTPLHALLFDHGVDYLCGAIILDIDRVMKTVAEGAVYRQIMRAGLRLVTFAKSATR